MDEGLLLPDQVVVHAAEVGRIEKWKARSWRCTGCNVTLLPKACDATRAFKRVPYFSRLKYSHHEEGCTADGLDKLVRKARRGPIRAEDILLGSTPAKITFRDHVSIAVDPSDIAVGHAPKGTTASAARKEKTYSHRPSATSIYGACRVHASLCDPQVRQMCPLEVEGCTGTNYLNIFHQLQTVPENKAPPTVAGCIFYGELRLKETLDSSSTSRLVLRLSKSRSLGDPPKTARFYELIVDWEQWTPKLRESFYGYFETRRSKSWNFYRKELAERRSPKSDLILYFLGTQVGDDPFAFRVSDWRKVALVKEPSGIYKDYPQSGFVSPEAELYGTRFVHTSPQPPDEQHKSSSEAESPVVLQRPPNNLPVNEPPPSNPPSYRSAPPTDSLQPACGRTAEPSGPNGATSSITRRDPPPMDHPRPAPEERPEPQSISRPRRNLAVRVLDWVLNRFLL